jgi:hypothetical protein
MWQKTHFHGNHNQGLSVVHGQVLSLPSTQGHVWKGLLVVSKIKKFHKLVRCCYLKKLLLELNEENNLVLEHRSQRLDGRPAT